MNTRSNKKGEKSEVCCLASFFLSMFLFSVRDLAQCSESKLNFTPVDVAPAMGTDCNVDFNHFVAIAAFPALGWRQV